MELRRQCARELRAPLKKKFIIPNLEYLESLSKKKKEQERQKWIRILGKAFYSKVYWVEEALHTPLFLDKYGIDLHGWYASRMVPFFEFSFIVQGKTLTLRTLPVGGITIESSIDQRDYESFSPYVEVKIGNIALWSTSPTITKMLEGKERGTVRYHGWVDRMDNEDKGRLPDYQNETICWGNPWETVQKHLFAILISRQGHQNSVRVTSPKLLKEMYADHREAKKEQRRRLKFLKDLYGEKMDECLTIEGL